MFNIFAGVKDKRFIKRGTILLLLGVLAYYLYCVTVGEQVNLLTTILPAETGWAIPDITNILTYGSLASVVLVFIINTVFMKVDAKKLIVISVALAALCYVFMGLSAKLLSFGFFFVSFLILRIIIVVVQHGTNLMCNNWWLANRGKALGICTIGAPIASATFVAITTAGQNSGMGFTSIYYVIAVCVAILAVLFAIFFKSSPEQMGLNPDGLDVAVEIKEEHGSMSIGDVLKRGDSWLIIISFGIFTFGTTMITAFFVTHMTMSGVTPAFYLPALSIGAIVGIPLSYLLGVIDDKWGTPKASAVMGLLYIVGFLAMYFTKGNNIGLIALAAVGYAGITGACPNLNPSINTYVYGRKNFLAATRVVMAVQMIIAAFANSYMGYFLNAGKSGTAYLLWCVAVVIAIVMVLIVGRKPAYDSPEAVAARAAEEAK